MHRVYVISNLIYIILTFTYVSEMRDKKPACISGVSVSGGCVCPLAGPRLASGRDNIDLIAPRTARRNTISNYFLYLTKRIKTHSLIEEDESSRALSVAVNQFQFPVLLLFSSASSSPAIDFACSAALAHSSDVCTFDNRFLYNL